MENYNINRNRKPLTDADVQKGKNFDAFMNAYTAKKPSFFRTGKFYVLAAAAGTVIAVGAYMLTGTSTPGNSTETTAFINPLFEEARNPDTSFVVEAKEGALIMNNNGSMIQVPKKAFLDSAGNIIDGKVELRYREFHDAAKIFMAGIPMTYDSAGTQYHFESAGMIEITAWQNGKPLKTNPDSLIHVAMISNSDEDRFNTYYLDTTAKKWKYINDEKAVAFSLPTEDSTSNSTVTTTPDAPPVPPKVADKNKPSFAIAFDPAEFPELTSYKGVRFQVDESVTPYNKDDKKVAWEDVVIERMKKADVLRVRFTAGSREAVYVTTPVVDEKDFAKAKASWEKRNAEYEAAVKAKAKREEELAKKNEEAMLEKDRHRIWVNDTMAARALRMRMAANLQSSTQSMIMREFVISDFGIWNADCPTSLPDDWIVNANMIDGKTGKPIEAHMFYLVEKNKNALFMYVSGNLGQFGFARTADNMIWAVTKDGKLATVSVDDFKTATANDKKEVTFKFTISDKPVANGAQARAQLGIPDATGS
ncbi:MAG: hypothetical protein L6Q81_17140 [Bacteroidia bacterium]|nr:hypothetical protein [Bacteroidia bacterium]